MWGLRAVPDAAMLASIDQAITSSAVSDPSVLTGHADPAAAEWGEDNPWFHEAPDLRQAAIAAHTHLLTAQPHLPLSDNLWLTTAAVRLRFPDRLSDVGFVFHARLGWLGEQPSMTLDEATALRPVQISFRAPATDAQEPDRFWLLPLGPAPICILPRTLGQMVAAIDGGGAVHLFASDRSALDAACLAIGQMSGIAGRA